MSTDGLEVDGLSSNDAPTTEATAGALRIWPREIIFFIVSVGCELLKRTLLPWSLVKPVESQASEAEICRAGEPAGAGQSEGFPPGFAGVHLCIKAISGSSFWVKGSEKHLSSVNRKLLAQMPRFHSPSGVSVPAGWNASAFPVESQDSMSAADVEIDKDAGAQQDGDGGRYEVCSEATSGWTRRVRIGKAPDEREMNPDRKTALELSVRVYAEKGDGHVVNPKIGTSFDSLDEAYEFYNLYSWETGFGFCTICRVQGHKCTTCPQRGDLPKAPRKLPKCTTKFPLD